MILATVERVNSQLQQLTKFVQSNEFDSYVRVAEQSPAKKITRSSGSAVAQGSDRNDGGAVTAIVTCEDAKKLNTVAKRTRSTSSPKDKENRDTMSEDIPDELYEANAFVKGEFIGDDLCQNSSVFFEECLPSNTRPVESPFGDSGDEGVSVKSESDVVSCGSVPIANLSAEDCGDSPNRQSDTSEQSVPSRARNSNVKIQKVESQEQDEALQSPKSSQKSRASENRSRVDEMHKTSEKSPSNTTSHHDNDIEIGASETVDSNVESETSPEDVDKSAGGGKDSGGGSDDGGDGSDSGNDKNDENEGRGRRNKDYPEKRREKKRNDDSDGDGDGEKSDPYEVRFS